MLEKRFGHEVEARAVFGEEFHRPRLLAAQDAVDLLVENPSGVVGVFTSARHEVFTEEYLLLASPGHRADLVAHAPLAHHAPSQTRDDFEVVGRTGGLLIEHEFFGGTTAQGHADPIEDVLT